MSKALLYIAAAIIIALGITLALQHNSNSMYQRQLSGALTEAERDLQSVKLELGIGNSKLLTQAALSAELATENAAVRALVKRQRLQLDSAVKAVANLRQSSTGHSAVKVENGITSYSWRDKHNRFSLKDPNILLPGDEIFLSNQSFSIRALVFKQRTGALKISQLTLTDIATGEQAKITSSEFKYTSEPAMPTSNSALVTQIGLNLKKQVQLSLGYRYKKMAIIITAPSNIISLQYNWEI